MNRLVFLSTSSTVIPTQLRLALRRLLKSPTTSALAVILLAVASGAHVAIFGLIHSLFLAPPPFPDVERLIGVYRSHGESNGGEVYDPLSFIDYRELGNAATSFEGLAAHRPDTPLSLLEDDRRVQVNGAVVSASYFAVLRIVPFRGRFFSSEEDEAPGRDPLAVISHGFWQSYFGGEEDVVGRNLNLNDVEHTVIGVAPKRFRGVFEGPPTQIWIPTMMGRVAYRRCDFLERDCAWLDLIGRLRPGRTLEQARGELRVLAERLDAAYRPLIEEPPGLSIAPLERVHPRDRRRLLRLTSLLLVSVTLLVLVVAANLGSLLLARTLERTRETAVLLAMGAARIRILFAVITETLLLSLAGGALGLLLAVWLSRAVAATFPGGAHLDLGVRPSFVGYTLALALFNSLVVALAPGIQATRTDLLSALKSTPTAADPRRPSALGALVVLQVSISVVLLISSTLILKSLWSLDRLHEVDPEQVATLRLRPGLVGQERERANAFTRRVLERLASFPKVESVAAADHLPPDLGPSVDVASHDSREAAGTARFAWRRSITSGFFDTFGLEILSGRGFAEADHDSAASTSIVSQSLAQTLWPGEEAIGNRVVVDGRSLVVVGVVQNEQYGALRRAHALHVYLPYWRDSSLTDARVAVRTRGDGAMLLRMVRGLVRALDRTVPVTELTLMSDRLALLSAPTRLAGNVMGLSGLVALALSAAGLFGVLSLSVARRTREIGIRMAVGASQGDTVGLIVLGALRQVAIAVGLGVTAAVASAPLLDDHLYGVDPHDPLGIAGAVLVVLAVAAVAAWIPARRAARVEPLAALRDE